MYKIDPVYPIRYYFQVLVVIEHPMDQLVSPILISTDALLGGELLAEACKLCRIISPCKRCKCKQRLCSPVQEVAVEEEGVASFHLHVVQPQSRL